MTGPQREEFWRRFHAEIDRFRDAASYGDVLVNSFEIRQWDVKFTRRRRGDPPASVTLAVVEHAPSREDLLLAVTPTYTVDDVDTFGERFLITVFLSPGTGKYSLHADHGPVEESQMAGFFMQMAGAMLSRL